MTDGETTWDYTYNADGLRTERTDGTDTYRYVYDGDKLTFMARNGLLLRFAYTPEGTPLSILYKGNTYYYVTNLQGDVTAILGQNSYKVVEYTYDAWGNLLSTTGSLASSLGQYNPLRYRGYVYDYETGLYYLQSRYYNPEIGRFLNADAYTTTGQGFIGNNMFAYCLNNPVICADYGGTDAIVLLDTNFPGHLGIMAQDKNGTWWHFYWGTTSFTDRALCLFYVNVIATSWCVEYTGALTLEGINNAAQFVGDYEKMMYFKGNFSDSINEMKYPRGSYHLYTNNCSQKSLRILAQSDTEYTRIFSKAANITLPIEAYNYIDKWASIKKALNNAKKVIFKKPINLPIIGGAHARYI